MLVERCDSSFLTPVYRKPTFTGLYLSWHSFAPRSKKLNLIRFLSYRALNICSHCKIEDELRVIKDIFINNGYPEEVIDDNIKFTVTRFKNKNNNFGPPKCPLYFRLPWVGSARGLQLLCFTVILLLICDPQICNTWLLSFKSWNPTWPLTGLNQLPNKEKEKLKQERSVDVLRKKLLRNDQN